MFKNAYQSGLLTVFYSGGSNPLGIWDMEVQNGHIKRLTDSEIGTVVLEIVSTNVARTYISCPKNSQTLGIRLPFMVMIIKNLKRYFSFEITIMDDKHMRRRFRISNFQSTTKIKPFCTTMPIALSPGWNQIQFNLADFTRRAYGSQFIETLRVQIHANARLRRIYFCDHLYADDDLPQEYKLFMPLDSKKKKVKDTKKQETSKLKVTSSSVTPAKSLSKAGSVIGITEPQINQAPVETGKIAETPKPVVGEGEEPTEDKGEDLETEKGETVTDVEVEDVGTEEEAGAPGEGVPKAEDAYGAPGTEPQTPVEDAQQEAVVEEASQETPVEAAPSEQQVKAVVEEPVKEAE